MRRGRIFIYLALIIIILVAAGGGITIYASARLQQQLPLRLNQRHKLNMSK